MTNSLPRRARSLRSPVKSTSSQPTRLLGMDMRFLPDCVVCLKRRSVQASLGTRNAFSGFRFSSWDGFPSIPPVALGYSGVRLGRSIIFRCHEPGSVYDHQLKMDGDCFLPAKPLVSQQIEERPRCRSSLTTSLPASLRFSDALG